MTQTEIFQIIASFVGSMGFGILFNIRGKRLWAASIGGLLSWLLYILAERAIGNATVAYFAVSGAITIYAEVMARVLKSPTTTFVITSLVPMIPGSSLYYTMISVFKSNEGNFVQRAVHTLELAAALALGVVAVTTFVRLLQRVVQYRRNQRKQ